VPEGRQVRDHLRARQDGGAGGGGAVGGVGGRLGVGPRRAAGEGLLEGRLSPFGALHGALQLGHPLGDEGSVARSSFEQLDLDGGLVEVLVADGELGGTLVEGRLEAADLVFRLGGDGQAGHDLLGPEGPRCRATLEFDGLGEVGGEVVQFHEVRGHLADFGAKGGARDREGVFVAGFVWVLAEVAECGAFDCVFELPVLDRFFAAFIVE